MAESVVLLGFWASPFGIRVRIALAEKGVEYEHKDENLQDKSPLLLQSNPVHKKIPVLIHGGKPVCESLIIVQYIDEVWKDRSPLMPHDPYQRANARFWADFVDNKVKDCAMKLCKTKGEAQAEAKEEFLGYLKMLEGELGDKQYFGGEIFGLADLTLISYSCWFHTFEIHGNFSIETECPILHKWLNRCLERESVSNALPHPHKILEYVGLLKKRFGIE